MLNHIFLINMTVILQSLKNEFCFKNIAFFLFFLLKISYLEFRKIQILVNIILAKSITIYKNLYKLAIHFDNLYVLKLHK